MDFNCLRDNTVQYAPFYVLNMRTATQTNASIMDSLPIVRENDSGKIKEVTRRKQLAQRTIELILLYL